MKKTKAQLHWRAVRLLRLTIRQLQRTPGAYNQNSTGTTCIKDGSKHTCESPACICGWMAFFRTRWWTKKEREVFHGLAVIPARNHSLIYLTEEQLRKLYYPTEWPVGHNKAKDWTAYTAQEAIARIRHFLKTDGRE